MRSSTNTISMKFLRRRSGRQTKNRIKSYEKVYSRGPHEDIDQMVAMAIDQGRDGMFVQIIQPTTFEGVALRTQIPDQRHERQPFLKPGLHALWLRGGDIREMVRHERAHVCGYGGIHQTLLWRAPGQGIR